MLLLHIIPITNEKKKKSSAPNICSNVPTRSTPGFRLFLIASTFYKMGAYIDETHYRNNHCPLTLWVLRRFHGGYYISYAFFVYNDLP